MSDITNAETIAYITNFYVTNATWQWKTNSTYALQQFYATPQSPWPFYEGVFIGLLLGLIVGMLWSERRQK